MKRFTFIELLVVIAIIGILVSLLLPSLKNARSKARNAVCLSNYQQNGVALSTYISDNNGRFPIHNGSQTYWLGQNGNTGMYTKEKFSILNKPLNKYLGHFEEGDIVPSSKCSETVTNDPAFLKYGTDYEANNHNKTAHSLQDDRTGFLAMVEEPGRMVTFYEEAVYELMYSMPVPEYMYKHIPIGVNRFNLSFVDGSVKALVSMQAERESSPEYTLVNGE